MLGQISVLALILLQYIQLSSGQSSQLIFIGDSITAMWFSSSRSIWDQYYGPMHAVNDGVGGASTQSVISSINSGLVNGLTPKVIVLMIGTNNLYDGVNGEEIAKDIKTIINLLQTKTKAKVLLLGILPRGDRPFGNLIKSINAEIAKYDNGNSIRFLDMWNQFVGSTVDSVKTNLYLGDKLHLVTEGYKVWAATMDPLLKQMMG